MSTDKKQGYIKLYRSIYDNWLWEDAEMLRAWIDILMLVNHKDKKTPFDGRLILVKRGSKITSLRQLSQRWGWSKDKTGRFLDTLEADGMIRQARDAKKTLITVINYGFYQGKDSVSETQKRHRTDTDKDTDETQNGTNKNDKECIRMIKNVEEAKPSAFSEDDDTDEEEGWGYD